MSKPFLTACLSAFRKGLGLQCLVHNEKLQVAVSQKRGLLRRVLPLRTRGRRRWRVARLLRRYSPRRKVYHEVFGSIS